MASRKRRSKRPQRKKRTLRQGQTCVTAIKGGRSYTRCYKTAEKARGAALSAMTRGWSVATKPKRSRR